MLFRSPSIASAPPALSFPVSPPFTSTAMYDPKSAPALLDGNARTLLTAPASPTLLQRLDNLVLRLICPRNAMHDKPGQGERGGGCETGIGGC
ncbi:hypothetical protein NBRC10513_006941 [Rhodotorula toruloides]